MYNSGLGNVIPNRNITLRKQMRSKKKKIRNMKREEKDYRIRYFFFFFREQIHHPAGKSSYDPAVARVSLRSNPAESSLPAESSIFGKEIGPAAGRPSSWTCMPPPSMYPAAA